MKDREKLLQEAVKCICSDRDIQYGTPEESFEQVSKFWSAWLDREITPHDVGMMMALFKIARIKRGSVKEDSYKDAAGYIACSYEIAVDPENNKKEEN